MAKVSPSWMLDDLFEPGIVYNPGLCYREPGLVPASRAVLDFVSGGHLALAGDFPVVCHRCASSPTVLRLLEEVGFPPARSVLQFETKAEYERILRRLVADGVRVAVGHVQAGETLDPTAYWVPRDLLSSLNDKGRLGDLVPESALARRDCLTAAEFSESAVELPVAVKVASSLPSGGGFGVRLCHTPDDWCAAQREFRAAPRVVVEEWLDIESIWCVQFILRPSTSPRYVGSTEQVAAEDGKYCGNWVAARDAAPARVVELGQSIAVAAAGRGYRGICGFDIVSCRDGGIKAIDANLRFNGSSVALALRGWMADRGAALARSRFWSYDGAFPVLADTVRAAVARGHFLPYALADSPNGPARVAGIVVGDDREQIEARIERLVSEGLR